MTDLTEPIAIVQALAAVDAPIDSEYGDCRLCDSYSQEHGPLCPWQRARNYIAELEATT